MLTGNGAYYFMTYGSACGFEVEHYGDACSITRSGTQSPSRFHD